LSDFWPRKKASCTNASHDFPSLTPITKFSRMVREVNFLTHGAPLRALASRARELHYISRAPLADSVSGLNKSELFMFCLKRLNTVLVVCEYMSYLPDHGTRKVAAHKLKNILMKDFD